MICTVFQRLQWPGSLLGVALMKSTPNLCKADTHNLHFLCTKLLLFQSLQLLRVEPGKFPGGSLDEGSGVVTAMAQVAAVAGIRSLAKSRLWSKKKKKKQKKKPNKPVVCLPLTFVFSTIGQTEVLEKSCGSEQTYVRSLVIIYPPQLQTIKYE